MTAARALAAAALLAGPFAACAGPPLPRPGLDVQPAAALDPAAFPGAAAILTGFDPPATGGDWRIGDRALFGLEVHDGRDVERRLLLLEVEDLLGRPLLMQSTTGSRRMHWQMTQTVTLTHEDGTQVERKIRTTPIRIRLVQYEADGAERSRSSATLFEELLESGIEPLHGSSDQDERVRSTMFLLALQRLGSADPTLAELLFTIVDRPSLLSLLLHFGATIDLSSPRGAEPVADDFGLPGLRLPGAVTATAIDVAVNGSPALYGDVAATRSEHPFSIAGGIIGAVARHASDPDRWAAVRLLASRRGAQ